MVLPNMEQNYCPDPRNCANIHYFGRCPYQHQACNRGPSCPYVKQNNCQFYHPEEDYPQYKAKNAVTMQPVHIKVVQKPLAGSVPPSEWNSLKKSDRNIAKRAASEVPPTIVAKVPPPPPLRDGGGLSYSSRHSPKRTLEDHKKQKDVLDLTLQTQVVATVTREGTIPNSEWQGVHPGVDVGDYAAKIKEQGEMLRALKQRVASAEEKLQHERQRAEDMQNDAQRFLTCWSRAVATLEMIRERGIYLDERLERAISCHSVALKSHEKGSIYTPGSSDINSGTRSSSFRYFSPNRRINRNRELPNRY